MSTINPSRGKYLPAAKRNQLRAAPKARTAGNRAAETLKQIVTKDRVAEFEEAAKLKGWRLADFLSSALESAAMSERFAREAGCDHCVLVPLSDAESAALLKQFDPGGILRIDQVLRQLALRALKGGARQ